MLDTWSYKIQYASKTEIWEENRENQSNADQKDKTRAQLYRIWHSRGTGGCQPGMQPAFICLKNSFPAF